MNQIYVLLLIGVALLAFFTAALVLRAIRPQEAEPGLPEAAAGLSRLLSLPALNFRNAAHLFDRGDYEFLLSAPSLSAVARDLFADRRRLVAAWLRQMQTDVRTLWRFRRLLTRHGAASTLGEELAVAVSAMSMLAVLFLMRFAVLVAGPFAVVDALRAAPRFAEFGRRACAVAFAKLPDSRLADVRAAWTRP